MASRPAPVLTLACFTVVEGALAVLTVDGADRRRATLPTSAVPTTGTLEQAGDQLARTAVGRVPVWRAQAGALMQEGLVLVVAAVVPAGTEAPAGSRWVALDRAPSAPGAAIQAGITMLRDRLDREPVAFRLLPPTFTLSELQQVYELLLERRLHKASFRRTLLAAHLVEPTEAWRSEGRGRPAQLFRYSPRRRRGVQRSVRFELMG
jgi:ADP-ribose pyrophosphatase YjhB (NUDIX family)